MATASSVTSCRITSSRFLRLLAWRLPSASAPRTLEMKRYSTYASSPSPKSSLLTIVFVQVKLLRAVSALTLDDLVIGQYTASPDGKTPGYKVLLSCPLALEPVRKY